MLVTRPRTRAGASFPGRVVTVPYGGRPSAHGRVLERSLFYPMFSMRVGEAAAALVRAGEVDLLDAQGLTALGYGRLRRREASLRAPLVMNPQGMEEHKARGLKRLALARLRALSREAAGLADRVVATDDATKGEVPRLLGVPEARVVVLPNGVDAEEIAALTPRDPQGAVAAALPAAAAARPLLLSVGRVEAYKGFDDTLAALTRLHAEQRLPAGWAWVVVGAGSGEAALRARIPRELGGHVHLSGRVAEDLLHALYARCDVFLHATRYEGSSLVTLEAMVHARPVVATRAGGIPDKVVHGETGWLCAPGDVDALAQGIAAVVGDPERARAMGAAGRLRAQERFSCATLISGTLAVYEALLQEAR